MPGPLESQVKQLLDSGIFEKHWYIAQSKTYFRSTAAAVQHYVEFGMAKEFSPHPLVEPRVWPQHLRNAWREGNATGVLNWFRRPKLSQPPMGPLFEARYFDIDDNLYAAHPGGLLGYFLEHATQDTILPTRFGDIPLRAVQASWPALYDRLKNHNRVLGARNTSSWDSHREAAWISSLGDDTDVALDRKVSVVMPAWNRASLVANSVRSVQAQTFENWELIVVDDGSDDATPAVIEALAAGDNRIRIIRLEHNGVSAARNAGILAADGDFVAFLDSDNTWPSTYLELMMRGMVQTEAKAAYAGIELSKDGKKQYRAFEGGLEHLLVLNHVDLNVFVVDRDVATATLFDENIRRWVDHDFAIRVARETSLELFPFIGCHYEDSRETFARITTTESDAWQWAVLGKNNVIWNQVSEDEIITGRVSVVIPIYQDWSMTLRATINVLENSEDHDIEVVLVDNGSSYYYGAAISQFFAGEPRVKYHRLPRNMNFAIGSNYGASVSTGEFVCFLNNDTEVRPGWLSPLLERITSDHVRGVQPLLQYPDDSIQTAGTVFLAPRTPPTHFLVGLPPEDAAGVSELDFSAVTAACLLVRRSEVAELKGFDPIFINGMEDVDYCLRAKETYGGAFAVEPRSQVTHHESKTPGRGANIPQNRSTFVNRWRDNYPRLDHDKFHAVGFTVTGTGGDKLWNPQPRPVVARRPDASQVRWGIRIPSVGGARGDKWGDTFYARSLNQALTEQGCKALTYRHGANTETERSYDDVNLVIRGLDVIHPIPDQVNVLWVISHPDEVTVDEIRAYDLVYAASSAWAADMSEKAGVEVRTLLQATDTSLFHPASPDEAITRRPLTFVGGNFPQRVRQSVSDALAAGVDLRVIGHGWKNLPARIHELEHIPNGELGGVYRGARRVLADHWTDMAELGFIQNRIFDAVACGTPVITDPVVGLDEVFGSLVQVYDGPDHLRYLCSDESDSLFGTPEERLHQAREVMEHHSFAARARTLINDVAEVRSRLFV